MAPLPPGVKRSVCVTVKAMMKTTPPTLRTLRTMYWEMLIKIVTAILKIAAVQRPGWRTVLPLPWQQ